MKTQITIDLAYLESLKRDLQNTEDELREANDKLKELDESKLKEKAVALAQRLLESYIAFVFDKLGFETKHQNSIVIRDNLEHYVGKDWYNKPERVKCDVNIEVVNDFKKAFLSLGVIPKKQDRNDTDYEL